MGLVVGAHIGETVGRAAAAEAKSSPSPEDVSLPGQDVAVTISGQTKETLIGTRPTQDLPTIPLESRPLPVSGKYDVVVIGGGTSGAAAGIGAARRGARTLVVEYQEGLGGGGTLGLIGRYHQGLRIGFTAEVPAKGGEGKMEWWRAELRKAGVDVR
jgi:NADPH-dependent 2,4-dienoyl-CoA reductase/sulfur reductase-like enzyme